MLSLLSSPQLHVCLSLPPSSIPTSLPPSLPACLCPSAQLEALLRSGELSVNTDVPSVLCLNVTSSCKQKALQREMMGDSEETAAAAAAAVTAGSARWVQIIRADADGILFFLLFFFCFLHDSWASGFWLL